MKDKKIISRSEHGYTLGRSCFINMISFYDEMTNLMDEGKAVGIIYLDFLRLLTLPPMRTS